MNDYKRRFVEVYEIIKHLPKEEFDKIPNDVLELIRKNKNSNYTWQYDDKKLKDKNIHKDTVAILSYINTEFILENKKKMLMQSIHYCNEMKNEELKREKFSPENIFNFSRK